MSVTKDNTKEIIKLFGKNEGDSGSSEVQVAILTANINNLSAHLKENKKDFQSRRGLITMVNKRRRLLTYIQRNDQEKYLVLIKKLNLRK